MEQADTMRTMTRGTRIKLAEVVAMVVAEVVAKVVAKVEGDWTWFQSIQKGVQSMAALWVYSLIVVIH